MIKRLSTIGIVIQLSGDGTGTILESPLKDGHEDGEQEELLAAINAVESLVLAHACAGIDVESAAYQRGVQTTLDAIANHFG